MADDGERKGSELEVLSDQACYGGRVVRYSHASTSTGTKMAFTVFMPKGASDSSRVPIVYYLAGLECSDKHLMYRHGPLEAHRAGVALVCPDTSPRGAGIEGEDDDWDFGSGACLLWLPEPKLTQPTAASFYIDATEPKWSATYKMYTYITSELPDLVARELPALDTSNASIFGHSMGGHGALTLALKNPTKYKSVSAFAPICHPTACPWGIKAFTGYLGTDEATWEDHDATLIMQRSAGVEDLRSLNILIDQGTNDKFYDRKQLLPEAFLGACKAAGHTNVEVRMQEGYDHSYYFVQTFLQEHLDFHAKHLKPSAADAVAAAPTPAP